MSWPRLMTESSEISQIIAEKVLASPKTSIAVFSYTTLSGIAAALDWISGALPTLAILAGFVGTLTLAWRNWRSGRLSDIQAENEKIRGRLLREKALDMGIELRTDDLP